MSIVYLPSGSMFESSAHSIFDKVGAHYNIYQLENINDVKDIFPDGKADNLNLCLFSTSGIHGSYTTIEDVEHSLKNFNKDDEDYIDSITILIIQPRLVCLRFGEIKITKDDIPFLKRLRKTSREAMLNIG